MRTKTARKDRPDHGLMRRLATPAEVANSATKADSAARRLDNVNREIMRDPRLVGILSRAEKRTLLAAMELIDRKGQVVENLLRGARRRLQ